MRFIRFSAALLLLFGAVTVGAFVGYINETGQVLRWNLVTTRSDVPTNVVNRSTRAIRYFISSEAFSSANRTNELNAVRAAFGQWESIPGTILKFEEGGLIGPGADINSADRTNVVFWTKGTTIVNGGLDDITGLQGHTEVAFANDNTILEADIALNGFEHPWFTDFSQVDRSDSFVESVVLHEIGHLIGLDHSPVGGATVTPNRVGISTELGLSSDEIAAARALYPRGSIGQTLSCVRGRVLMNGAGIFGAMITAEDASGNVAAGTVSRRDGTYEIPAIAPGEYKIRASPLDPTTAPDGVTLMRGPDIAFDYDTVVTAFLPTTNRMIRLNPGVTNALDFTVTSGNPFFRVSAISFPAGHPSADTHLRACASIRPGQSAFVGVSLTTIPAGGATLSVTGDGITVGPTVTKPNRFADQPLLSVAITVAANATPGLRSFVVQEGSHLAYANGYLEVLPPFEDFNFDGLDDSFQRRYFPVFTVPEAAPEADPDGDGYTNRYEWNTGSNPMDRLSFNFRITSVTLAANGTTIRWDALPGKRYQVFSRRDFSAGWQAVGNSVTATGVSAQLFDSSAKDKILFYRVQALP